MIPRTGSPLPAVPSSLLGPEHGPADAQTSMRKNACSRFHPLPPRRIVFNPAQSLYWYHEFGGREARPKALRGHPRTSPAAYSAGRVFARRSAPFRARADACLRGRAAGDPRGDAGPAASRPAGDPPRPARARGGALDRARRRRDRRDDAPRAVELRRQPGALQGGALRLRDGDGPDRRPKTLGERYRAAPGAARGAARGEAATSSASCSATAPSIARSRRSAATRSFRR